MCQPAHAVRQVGRQDSSAGAANGQGGCPVLLGPLGLRMPALIPQHKAWVLHACHLHACEQSSTHDERHTKEGRMGRFGQGAHLAEDKEQVFACSACAKNATSVHWQEKFGDPS